MSSDGDRQASDPPVVTTGQAANDPVALAQTPPPLQPETLVEGLRYLQQRIPELTQLSVQEKRSHARAANLDPEFIESGLQAAAAWHDTKLIVQRSSEDLWQEHEEIRRWDEVILALRAITEGLEAANVKRRHRLGNAILMIYRILGACFRGRSRPADAYMRPYYENMKRAYRRTQTFRKRTKKEAPPAE